MKTQGGFPSELSSVNSPLTSNTFGEVRDAIGANLSEEDGKGSEGIMGRVDKLDLGLKSRSIQHVQAIKATQREKRKMRCRKILNHVKGNRQVMHLSDDRTGCILQPQNLPLPCYDLRGLPCIRAHQCLSILPEP